MKDPEKDRLETVRLFKRLNFSKNNELNDIVKLAAEICNVPIAMITLMGKNTQWIKCKTGVDISKNSREKSFCKYLINEEEVLVIPDTLNDSRFVKESSQHAGYGIRFYAGAPLITSNGHHLGSLCIFDLKPQSLSKKQKEMLAILSRQVTHLMELEISLIKIEQNNKELSEQKEQTKTSELKLRAFFNSSSFCHILIGKNLEVIDFNKATSAFIKGVYQKKIRPGTNILDYISFNFKDDFTSCLACAFAGKPCNKEILIRYSEDVSIWWNISVQPVIDQGGNITSVACNASNINKQKQQIEKITTQNKSLLNIAHIQSHEYRRPVASILGLMHLIKEDNYEPHKEYLLMLERAVTELDEQIKKVINCTEVIYAKNLA